MKICTAILWSLLASGVFIAPAMAATERGNGSLGGLLSYTNTDTTDIIFLNASVSYFFTAAFEAGVNVSWVETIFDDADGNKEDNQQVIISPSVQWNFLTKRNVMPFIGASYDFWSGDEDLTDYYSLFLGLRHFVAENVAMRYELRYSDATDDEFEDLERTNLFIGIDWFF